MKLPHNLKRIWPLVVAGIVAFAVYLPALQNDFVIDDYPFIMENPVIRSLSNLKVMFTSSLWGQTSASTKALYRPFLSISFALNYKLGGLEPFGYHFVNNLLHSLNVVLLYLLVFRVSCNRRISFLSALIFGLHPVNTEAVNWVAARSELLSACFSIASVYAYLRFLAADCNKNKESWIRRARWQIASFFFMLFALLSREAAVALPVVIVLLDFRFPSKWRARLLRLLPFTILAVSYLLLIKLFIFSGNVYPVHYEFNVMTREAFLPRIVTGFALLAREIYLLLWPARLSIDYSLGALEVYRTPWSLPAAAGLAIWAGLGVLAVFLRRRRGDAYLGCILLICYGGLLFVNSLLPAGSLFAERYLYTPALGISILAGVCGGLAFGSTSGLRPLAAVVVPATMLLMSVSTFVRCMDWKDNLTILKHDIAVRPKSIFLHTALSAEYFKLGDYQKAAQLSARAIEIYPAHHLGHLQLGDICLQGNNTAGALVHLQRAVELEPGSSKAQLSLGLAYFLNGNTEKALEHYRIAMRLNPADPQALNNYANLQKARGNTAEAVQFWEKALAVAPHNPEALFNLAQEMERSGNTNRARALYTTFIKVAPGRLQKYIDAAKTRID